MNNGAAGSTVPKVYKRRSIKTKALAVVCLAIFVISAILGYVFFNFSKQRITFMMGETIKGIASITANFIPPEDFNLVMVNTKNIWKRYLDAREQRTVFPHSDSEDTGAPVNEGTNAAIKRYIMYSKMLANIKLMNRIDSPINIYTRKSRELELIITSDDVLLLGTKYHMREEAAKAFSTGMPQATKIYRDKDGAWISAYAPITYIIPGNVIGIVEINYKITTYLENLEHDLVVIILICLAGFFIVSIMSFPLVDRLVGNIKRLDTLATDLEQGKYDTKVKVASDDEIGHLAETFESLRLSIRDKINKLQSALKRERRAHLESIIALTNAIELRDPYTRGHVYRVEKYALLIAKKLKLTKDEVESLKYSCFLHDVGKIDIEAALLQKKGALSKEDFELIKKHSEKGAQIVEGIRFLRYAKDAILYHQEHYDGKGYPMGLKGESIPLLARIVSVADAFDAMTTDRPYSKKRNFKDAMNEIEKHSGTQFDPHVCEAFLTYRDAIEKIAEDHFEDLKEIA